MSSIIRFLQLFLACVACLMLVSGSMSETAFFWIFALVSLLGFAFRKRST
ncbi:MAG: hypothetical protein HC921_17620 [Synechococcaceae cyanobacterium SM2_3_1]|nr:hypothetical protein [Synechococcaceae cyanobacterium SM2_3_1]